jgi:hypothetical protein
VVEVPVRWGHVGGTRINPLVDGAHMVQEMLHIRWYDLTGKYNAHSKITSGAVETVPGRPAPRV